MHHDALPSSLRVPQLVLASQSPRRRSLLETAGYRFDVISADVDEVALAGELARAMALRLAIEKATAVVERAPSGSIVVAADTVVTACDKVYGKPVDVADAVRILGELVGRNHDVITGFALVQRDRPRVAVTGLCRSSVRMREASEAELRAYVESGEPMDKAGAYAAQGLGRRFIAAVIGPLDNVIGLPMTQVRRALERCGIRPCRGDHA
jgi:septum formation protein